MIRWDRIGRVALLVVLVGLATLYVKPTISFFETRREAAVRAGEVAKLEAQNRRLKERKKALQDPRALEREARRLGMVKPGERAYVIKGLPKD